MSEMGHLRPRARSPLTAAYPLIAPCRSAKAAGVYKGRRASIDVARVRETKAKSLGATAIAKAFGIGRASVYRVPEAVYVQVETRAGSAAWA